MSSAKIFDLVKHRELIKFREQEFNEQLCLELEPRRLNHKTYCELILENPELIHTGLLDLALSELIGHKLKKQREWLNARNNSTELVKEKPILKLIKCSVDSDVNSL